MNKFEIGEIAITIIDPTLTVIEKYLQYNGEECVVIALPRMIDTKSCGSYMAYEVEFYDGATVFVAPHELKKIIPPADQKTIEWAKKKVQDLFVVDPTIVLSPATEEV
jgi:hypothetical protein